MFSKIAAFALLGSFAFGVSSASEQAYAAAPETTSMTVLSTSIGNLP